MATQITNPENTTGDLHWYHGNCHCGYIRFKFSYPIDLARPEGSPHQACICDCSLCTKLGWILCYPDRRDVWVRVPGSGAPDSDADERGGEGWAHPRDNEKGTGYRCGKDFMFSGPQGDEGDLTKKALPLLAYVHAAKECDVVFCGVCGCSLWLDTRAEFAERDGDIISMNVRLFKDIDTTKIVTRPGRGKSFPPEYVPQYEP